MRPPLPTLALLAVLGAGLPCCASWRLGDPVLLAPLPPEPGDAARERAARRALEDARAFEMQGRTESAERAARRGLDFHPDDPKLLRLLARLLEAQGRHDEAGALLRRADALDPPPPPLPDEPLPGRSQGLVALLLPPLSVPGQWPDPVVAETLERRLHVRLPDARVLYADLPTVRNATARLEDLDARAALSLEVVRAYCDQSVKDGRFAVVVLRTAVEVRGEPGHRHERARAAEDDPVEGERCAVEATARALEEALADERVARALAAHPAADAHWSRGSVRALFPGLDVRIRKRLTQGQRWLGSGHLALAEESFERAARIDPEDPEVVTYLHEVRETLAIANQLAGNGGAGGDGGAAAELPPRLSASQRSAAEAQLAAERRRRETLLAALAVLDEDVRPPSVEHLDALTPAPIIDPDDFGPARAQERAGGPVEMRLAYAPDGSVIARYYLRKDGGEPVLREEDTSRDGRPDRWIAYAAGARREIWEDGRGRGRPDVRIVFAEGGTELERIEIDPDLDGRPDRVFQYADGRLRIESRDTTHDGVLDRFDRFDDGGEVVMREEDRDGDGRIDVRSIYRAGKLVRRELSDPSLAPGDT